MSHTHTHTDKLLVDIQVVPVLQFELGLGLEVRLVVGFVFNSSNLLRLTAQLFRHPVAQRRGKKKEEKRKRRKSERARLDSTRQLKRGANTKHLVGATVWGVAAAKGLAIN